MPDERITHTLDVITAGMLGLVAVVTALGALQASSWDQQSQEFGRDAGDARDVSVNQSVLADYTMRADLEASSLAKSFADQGAEEPDPFEQMILDAKITSALTSTTLNFAEGWRAWQASGFDPATDPMAAPDYLVARDGTHQSYAVAGAELDLLSHVLQNRSGVLAQAALIQALALFLIGIAGVNRARSVRIALLALGGVVFILGIVLALSSYGVSA